jgi:hypothetical protein
MATYRSAWRLIEGLKQPSRKTPNLLSRYSLAWSQALSATVCSLIHIFVEARSQFCVVLDCDVSACDPSAKLDSGYFVFRGVGHGGATIYIGCFELSSGIK